jgi:hypothetical protein
MKNIEVENKFKHISSKGFSSLNDFQAQDKPSKLQGVFPGLNFSFYVG